MLTKSELNHLGNGKDSVISFMGLSKRKKRLATKLLKQRLDKAWCWVSPIQNINQINNINTNKGNHKLNNTYYNLSNLTEKKRNNSPDLMEEKYLNEWKHRESYFLGTNKEGEPGK